MMFKFKVSDPELIPLFCCRLFKVTKKTVKANVDINKLNLARMQSLVSQFIDGSASCMLTSNQGEWQVDPEQTLGQM